MLRRGRLLRRHAAACHRLPTAAGIVYAARGNACGQQARHRPGRRPARRRQRKQRAFGRPALLFHEDRRHRRRHGGCSGRPARPEAGGCGCFHRRRRCAHLRQGRCGHGCEQVRFPQLLDVRHVPAHRCGAVRPVLQLHGAGELRFHQDRRAGVLQQRLGRHQ